MEMLRAAASRFKEASLPPSSRMFSATWAQQLHNQFTAVMWLENMDPRPTFPAMVKLWQGPNTLLEEGGTQGLRL
jgi:hypothetical protein